MNIYSEAILTAVEAEVESLSWQCRDCPRISQCEDQAQEGESRYCWPLIVAAIKQEDTFKTLHKGFKSAMTERSEKG